MALSLLLNMNCFKYNTAQFEATWNLYNS